MKKIKLGLSMIFYVRFSGISFLFFGESNYPLPENFN